MLQIIGWLGCVYLFVKGLELLSSNSHRSLEGKLHTSAAAGAVIAFAAAVLFFVFLSEQGSAMGAGTASTYDAPTGPAESLSTNLDELTTEDLDAAENMSMPRE